MRGGGGGGGGGFGCHDVRRRDGAKGLQRLGPALGRLRVLLLLRPALRLPLGTSL